MHNAMQFAKYSQFATHESGYSVFMDRKAKAMPYGLSVELGLGLHMPPIGVGRRVKFSLRLFIPLIAMGLHIRMAVIERRLDDGCQFIDHLYILLREPAFDDVLGHVEQRHTHAGDIE